MNLNTIIEQRDALNVEITRIQNERRAQHVAEIRALMAATGVTLTDLGAPAPPAPKVRFQRSAPVAPKYRDAAGNTWSGRGFKPVWLREALAAGAALESFQI